MKAPGEFSKYQLEKVGVLIVTGNPMRLRCRICAEEWNVAQKGLRLPKGYWKCPKGCNGRTESILSSRHNYSH